MSHPKPNKDLPPPMVAYLIQRRIIEYPKPEGEDFDHLKEDCWIFIQGDQITDGRIGCKYGTISFNGKVWLVHRTLWEFFHQRKMPGHLEALHGCDRPRCCNPDHLRPGTRQENVDDYERRIRNPAKGMRNGAYTHPEKRPKNERIVELEIKEDIAGLIKGCLEIMGTDLAVIFSIAAHFRTTAYIIQQAASGEIWRNVEPVTPKVLPRIIDIDPDLL